MKPDAVKPDEGARPLSPVSRRVFLLAAPTFLAACGSGDDDPYPDCIYCDAAGQDYEECDSDYCDYFDEA